MNDTNDELLELLNDDEIDAQRSIIRQSLDEIANDVGMAMRDARLDFPLGLTVPISGNALTMMVTPFDPSEEDWLHATDIVCQIVAERLGGAQLRNRPLPCAMVNAPMTAAVVTADVQIES